MVFIVICKQRGIGIIQRLDPIFGQFSLNKHKLPLSHLSKFDPICELFYIFEHTSFYAIKNILILKIEREKVKFEILDENQKVRKEQMAGYEI